MQLHGYLIPSGLLAVEIKVELSGLERRLCRGVDDVWLLFVHHRKLFGLREPIFSHALLVEFDFSDEVLRLL